jgi:hypothetical protein
LYSRAPVSKPARRSIAMKKSPRQSVGAYDSITNLDRFVGKRQ